MMFSKKIEHQNLLKGTCLCLGIDPPLDVGEKGAAGKIPSFFFEQWKKLNRSQWTKEYSLALLEAAQGLISTVKPQSAYFEAHGWEGIKVLEEVIMASQKLDLLTVLDVKRGDIASTMEAYASMAFDSMGADSMTVTAYMGTDVLRPLLPWIKKGKGVYIVWVSSNPSGLELQSLCASPLLNSLKQFKKENNIEDALGLVYGATKIEERLTQLNQDLKEFYLLMPGIGAQGGKITRELKDFLRNHPNALVPQSRSLGQLTPFPGETQPYNWDDFKAIVRKRVSRAIKDLSDYSG